MRFSASRLKLYMNCPLAAHYRYDEHLPRQSNAAAVWGKIVHTCMEHYNLTGEYDIARRMFIDMWDAPEDFGHQIDYWPKNTSKAGYMKTGLEMLAAFHKGLDLQKRRVIGAEVPFCVPFGEHELMGYIDLVELRRSGNGKYLLRVLDWKTGGRQPTKAQLALDVQFTVYMYATTCKEFWVGNGEPEFPGLPDGEKQWELLKDLPRRAIWFHMRGPKEIDAGPREAADYMRLYRVCDEIERSIEHQVFIPKIGEACELCDYVEPCEMEIPVDLEVKKDDPNAWL